MKTFNGNMKENRNYLLKTASPRWVKYAYSKEIQQYNKFVYGNESNFRKEQIEEALKNEGRYTPVYADYIKEGFVIKNSSSTYVYTKENNGKLEIQPRISVGKKPDFRINAEGINRTKILEDAIIISTRNGANIYHFYAEVAPLFTSVIDKIGNGYKICRQRQVQTT